MNGMFKVCISALIVCICLASPCFSIDKGAAETASDHQKETLGADSTEENKELTKVPAVFFPAPEFKFDSMVEGEELRHDFVIGNKGKGVLRVEKIETTCGCTTVSHSKEIPPGCEGKISMKVNTNGYGGSRLTKTISVITNDTMKPESTLTVSGNIDRFVTITPPVVRLSGNIGDKLKSIVKIIPTDKYPFSIASIRNRDGQNIRYKLKKENSSSGRKEYSVTVENAKKDAGFYYDVLILATDSKIQPEIKITVMGRIINPNAPL